MLTITRLSLRLHCPHRYTCLRPTSSYTPYDPSKKNRDVEATKNKGLGSRIREAILGKRKKEALFTGRSQAPLNWNYPNPKFIDDYNPEISLQEARDQAGELVDRNVKLVKQEFKNYYQIERPIFDSILGPTHEQLNVDYHYRDDEQMKRWQTGCDSDWGEGYSKCEFKRTEFNTAIFSGYTDSRIINTGKIERAGWASIKTIERASMHRHKHMKHWQYYSHFMIKCRGDGRSYKIMLCCPGFIDVTWGDSYSYHLHTHGGPYWQYEQIPFSRFIHTVGGRVQDRQQRVPSFEVSSICIVIMDRIDGPFRLEIDYIGVVKDWTHNEKFAYETYNIPCYNPESL
ncbi:CIA30 domain-containing protein [Aphelenchoides besseyi]|nr:CIA30 domain-containing protein [Aphelenchoides besseyi]